MLDEFNASVAGTGQARASGGGEAVGRNDKEQQRAYLHLALSIISAFCRLPEFAAMDETICKVPILVETLSSKYNLPPSFSIVITSLCVSSMLKTLCEEFMLSPF